MLTDIVVVVRFCLAYVFLAAVAGKLREGQHVAAIIAWVLPGVGRSGCVAHLFRWGLVILEGLIGCSLLVGYALREAALAAAVSLLAFTVVLWRLRATGWTGGCGCFGMRESSGGVGHLHIARNLLLVTVALLIFSASYETGATLPPWHLNLAFPLVSVAVSLTLWFIYEMAQSLADLRQDARSTGEARLDGQTEVVPVFRTGR
ncbi:MauE/DoxX family redox-associated membrane protein [Candidatus Palauibacter sp.]|uniref:MauE/DoxX family redox-associated membrane protein n=1 Tax=Candidatus Palauibacter sp. TaxID=3101350 RepID=UPI003B51F79A